MEGVPPKTTQEVLDLLGAPCASESETQQAVNSPNGKADLYDDAPPHDVISSLSSNQLEQWISQTARQFEVDGDGIGRMLVAELAMLHNKIRRLMDRHDVTEATALLVPWTSAITKLMAEFRRGYFALCKLQDSRERRRQRQSKASSATTNGKSHAKKGAGFLIERQQLNASN